MNYIQIVLLVYLLLRIIDFFPSQNYVLNNQLQSVLLICLLILLASFDTNVCLLVLICILVNLKNEAVENLFTPINSNEIQSIQKTIVPTKQEDIKTIASTKQTIKKEECIPEFIISKDMLNKAQNNIVDNNAINQFINETNTKGVNIQGVYEDITGYYY